MRQPRRRHRPVRADFLECLENRLLMARLTGIDVSQFQGTMNWDVAVSQGIKFAFIRGSRSDTVPDTKLAANMHPSTGAKAKGLVVGVYHRALPFGNVDDIRQDPGEPTDANYIEPEVDAQNYWNAAGAYMGPGYMRPVIDVEDGATLNTTPHVNAGGTPTPTTNLSQWVTRFVTKLKQLYSAARGGAQITPMIYTGHYRSNLNSTVVAALPDLWIANWEMVTYGDPVNGNGGPPTSPWPGWKFWQYDSAGNQLADEYGSSNPETSDIDLDVFNGSDINVLKQNHVIGAAAIPSGPSPANNATGVSPTVTLNWADSANAVAYDVYIDDVLRASNVAQSQWTVSSPLASGSHTWRVVAKGVISDDDTHTTRITNWTFTVPSVPPPGVPSGGTPHNVFVTSNSVVLDWDDASNATSYDVYLGGATTPSIANLTVSETGPLTPTDGLRLWRVVARNEAGSTDGPQWQYTKDATPPSATYGGQTPSTYGAAVLDFTVTYADATSGVDFTSLDSSDVYVKLPDGETTIAATLVGIDANANGATRIATYRIAAPGGTWDTADNGTYTVHQNGNQVGDVAGTFRAAGQIDSFVVNLTQPFAYQVGTVLHVDFDGTLTPVALAHDAGTFAAMRGSTTLNFNGVTAITVHGTPGADLLELAGAVPVPLDFDNGTGDDAVTVTGGEYTFADDLNPTLRNVDVTVAAGAAAVFASTQHLDRLTINGTAAVAAGGGNTLVVRELLMSDAGRLDLSDNDMVVDYDVTGGGGGGGSPIGGFDGTSYTGVSGRIAAAYNFGSWDGPGIFTSQELAGPAQGLATLAIAEAAEIYFLGGPSETALFGAETVDGSAVIIKYTYAGDLNFDGYVDAGDYGVIDNWIQFPGTDGYVNGDFNYDGIIDAADYGIIDNTIQLQGTPL